MAWTVKHLPTMQGTWVQSLGLEDLLEKEMATHSSILAWKIPWMEEPGGLYSHGVAKSQTRLSNFISLHFASGLGSEEMLRERQEEVKVSISSFLGYLWKMGLPGDVFH